jgi:hypothetical protein
MWHARIVFLTRLCGKLRELFAIKVRNFKGMETPRPHRFFLLSPASVGGKRAGMFAQSGAPFEIARRLHSGGPVSLGEAFAFMSGLYFRGKLAYASAFARPPAGSTGVHLSRGGLLLRVSLQVKS